MFSGRILAQGLWAANQLCFQWVHVFWPYSCPRALGRKPTQLPTLLSVGPCFLAAFLPKGFGLQTNFAFSGSMFSGRILAQGLWAANQLCFQWVHVFWPHSCPRALGRTPTQLPTLLSVGPCFLAVFLPKGVGPQTNFAFSGSMFSGRILAQGRWAANQLCFQWVHVFWPYSCPRALGRKPTLLSVGPCFLAVFLPKGFGPQTNFAFSGSMFSGRILAQGLYAANQLCFQWVHVFWPYSCPRALGCKPTLLSVGPCFLAAFLPKGFMPQTNFAFSGSMFSGHILAQGLWAAKQLCFQWVHVFWPHSCPRALGRKPTLLSVGPCFLAIFLPKGVGPQTNFAFSGSMFSGRILVIKETTLSLILEE